MQWGPVDRSRIGAEAIEWFMLLRRGETGKAVRKRFVQWLLASAFHVHAFLTTSRVGAEVGRVPNMPPPEELVREAREDKSSSNVVELRAARAFADDDDVSVEPIRQRTRGPWVRGAIAAGVLTLALATGWFTFDRDAELKSFRTQVGEQRSVQLDDGSTIYLNTDTALMVRLTEGERRIVLTRGEAKFMVAKDRSRPFTVTTREAEVVALGTTFNVRVLADDTIVSVIEGRINVRRMKAGPGGNPKVEREGGDAVVLGANEQVAVSRMGRIQSDAGPPFERAVEWTQQRIDLKDETLANAVAEFNRYQKQPLRIADAELAGLRINGAFNAFERSALIEYLARYIGVRVEERGGILYLRKAPKQQPETMPSRKTRGEAGTRMIERQDGTAQSPKAPGANVAGEQ